MTKAAPASPIKKPRSLTSGSPILETAYAVWLQSLFDTNCTTFQRIDVPAYRALVIAGTCRFVHDNKTGLLHAERILENGKWSKAGPRLPQFSSFWLPNAESASIVRSAWRASVDAAMPSVAECYPEGLPSKFKVRSKKRTHFDTVEELYESRLNHAALRRLGAKNGRSASRGLVAGLWNFLADKAVLQLCHAFFGRQAGMVEYNFTVLNRAQLEQLSRETPSLTPLIGAYLVQMHAMAGDYRTKPHPIPHDVVSVIKKHFMAGTVVSPEGVVSASMYETLSTQAWRYLAHLKRSDIHTLVYFVRRDYALLPDTLQKFQSRILPLITMLAQNGAEPPMTLLKFLLRTVPRFVPVGSSVEFVQPATNQFTYPHMVYLDAQYRPCVRQLLRLLTEKAIEARKLGRVQSFVKTDVLLIWDWFSARLPIPDLHRPGIRIPEVQAKLSKHTSWNSLMRMQHEWHENEAVREEAQRLANHARHLRDIAAQEAMTWESLVPAQIFGDVKVKPLLTGKSLRTEGRVMKHCVGRPGFSNSCHRGDTRIFSLNDGRCRATLELRKSKTKWHVAQFFSIRNTPVSSELTAAAKTLASTYSKAEARKAQLKRAKAQ